MIDFDKSKYYYDKKKADKIITFIEKHIRHIKGEYGGQLIKLEEWQKEDILKPVFGIYRKSNRTRRFRTVYVEVPRKNAKSTLGAAIGLFMLNLDGEIGAEIYSAAADRSQASIIFDIAKQMVLSDPVLSTKCRPYMYSIVKNGTANSYKVISAEADTKHGYNPHGILFDELHAQKNRELWDVLNTGKGARLQPITFAFTTAGFDKQTICYEVHKYAIKVRDGIIKDDSFLSVIYAADTEDDIYLEETWKKANPGYGTIVKKEYIEQQVNQVRNNPYFENTFRRLHLNQWTESETRWIQDNVWMECGGEGEPTGICYGGLDLASTRDITALVLYFPDTGFVLSFFFIPELSATERTQKDGVNYAQWVKEGYIIQTPGNVTDYNFIKHKVRDIAEIYQLKSIAYDRYNASQLVIDLQEDGINMSPFGQGFVSMSAPTKELEKKILNKEIVHGSNPVLRWMCSNIMLRTDPAGNIKIDKGKSSEKVDGMVALIMALGEAMTDDTPSGSVYDERGVLTI